MHGSNRKVSQLVKTNGVSCVFAMNAEEEANKVARIIAFNCASNTNVSYNALCDCYEIIDSDDGLIAQFHQTPACNVYLH